MTPALRRSVVPTARGAFCALTAGPADGKVTLLLHGFPDLPDGFAPIVEALAAEGRRVVAPYLRGYWPSPLRGPFDLETLTGDVVDLARTLSPGARCDLVAHDWGAVIAYAALAEHPASFDAAVTLAVPHPLSFLRALLGDPAQRRRSWYMGLFQLPFAEHLVRRDDFALVERLYREWSPGFAVPSRHLELVKRCFATSLEGPLGYYRAMLSPPATAIRRVLAARRRRIPHPTLHLAGAQDGCIGAEVGADDARFFDGPRTRRVLPGVGHFLHLEAPDVVAAEVIGFLGRR